jgi:hypothetical protein
MKEKTLLGMSDAEFDKLIETYIEREETNPGEVGAELFFTAVADFLTPLPEIELVGEIESGAFKLKPQKNVPPEVTIEGNRIVAPGFTFVIRMAKSV